MKKNAPGCLGYIRDYITQVYRDYKKLRIRIQPVFHGNYKILFVAQVDV